MVVQGPAQEVIGALDRRRYVFVNDYGTNYNVGGDRCGKYLYKFEYHGTRETNACANAQLEHSKLH